eukprot:2641681-Prymnesium_polylepis.1
MPDADVILNSLLLCAALLGHCNCVHGAIDEQRVEFRPLPFFGRHAPASAKMLAKLSISNIQHSSSQTGALLVLTCLTTPKCLAAVASMYTTAPCDPPAQLRSVPYTPRRQWLCQPRVSSPPGGASMAVLDGSIASSRRFCSFVSSSFHFDKVQPRYVAFASASSPRGFFRARPAASRALSASSSSR